MGPLLTNSLLRPVPRDRPVGRYAPSPTGDLHLGNLRTALVAWQDIRSRGGIFILRMEDIDGPRTVPGAAERIMDDLRWLGIDWDEGPDIGGPAGPYVQSQRGSVYEAALHALEASGAVYYCTCSRKDLTEASAPHGPEGPVYPGTCRSSGSARQRAHAGGAAARLFVDDNAEVEFADEMLGPQFHDLREVSGDFIVRRRDGLWAYQLACAVDDALMGVTRVVRGADLATSTPRQIAVMRALGLPVPTYSHVPLVVDASGARMSKRDGSRSLRALRESGCSPEQARDIVLQAPVA